SKMDTLDVRRAILVRETAMQRPFEKNQQEWISTWQQWAASNGSNEAKRLFINTDLRSSVSRGMNYLTKAKGMEPPPFAKYSSKKFRK
ncbi:MAG: hypothetical protein AAFW66_15835, partial [Pseudomonadota bacterium]